EACIEDLMMQARKIKSGSQHDERPSSGAVQKETRRVGSIQEYRGSSEEDKEHPAPRSPFRHCCSSCFD
ncbi:hypothetical protein V3C99_003446, partial [Haemonchus contortus]